MPLQETSGNISADAYGGGAAAIPNYIEDVFSTYLYTGTGAAQTITNNILLGNANATVSFATPALMNGSTVAAQLRSVAVNSSGLYVAVGSNGNNYPIYATSTDGSTWTTPALMNGSSVYAVMQSITVNSSGLFVAVGYDANNYPLYATSSNGSTWTTPALMNGSSVYAVMQSITVNSSGLFVAVGRNSSIYPLYATSSNGSTWTTPALMNGSSVYADMRGIAVNSSGKFVAVGWDFNGIPLYATSSNGSTWTTPAAINGTTTATNMYSITVNNTTGRFVAVGVGAGSISGYPMFATSTDGSTWTTPSSMNGSTANARMNSVAVNSSGLFTAVGYNTTNGYPLFSTSTDGSTWTTPAQMNNSTSSTTILGVSVNSSGKFVSVGYNSSSYPLFSPSTDVPAVTGKGGMVWLKDRTNAYNNNLFDTAQGATKLLHSNTTDATITDAASLTAFSANGFALGTGNTTGNQVNTSADNFASWTFRKQPKFFDVVTYTGNGANRTISHNLGSVPGCILIKCTSSATNWWVYHQSLSNTQYMVLNSTASVATATNAWNSTTPTDSVFSLGNAANVNGNGSTYVAYLFAHNAGGFGLTGTDNVISCGSYTGTGSAPGPTITLGYEPQWVLIKRTDIAGYNWICIDNMRSMSYSASYYLYPNTTDAEVTNGNPINPMATGFSPYSTGAALNASGGTYIYIAIRRGPMKVPTDATKVFSVVSQTVVTDAVITTNFAPDMVLSSIRTIGDSPGNHGVMDKLRGLVATASTFPSPWLVTSSNVAEGANSPPSAYKYTNTGYSLGGYYNGYSSVFRAFQRAPGFFDEVCYTGTGSTQNIAHNLQVRPEIIITKSRLASNWMVYVRTGSNVWYLGNLNSNVAMTGPGNYDAIFTATTFNNAAGYASGVTYVTYLFASCSGVSKVGSYTGTGAAQTINCGFAAGARFVMIKRVDSTGDWYVWDTARGMVSGTDPSLSLNTAAAEVNANSVYTTTGGFQIVSTAAGINASGGTYLYLAIA